MVGQLNLIETGNLVTFMKEGYRLSCTQYVSMNLSDAASCAINCLSSDNCAGLTYNSSNNLCSTCPGNDVTDLLFVADDFMLPRTEWFTKLDATNLIYFPLKSTLNTGSLVYMSLLAVAGTGYTINLMGQGVDYYILHFKASFPNGAYSDTIVNSCKAQNWGTQYPVTSIPCH
ncbi:hypothetical protein Btru_068399 [Bulinus truncatus]|nr:hypothetical protein Btru_068399 [Bulinus truncatus]